MDCSMPAGANDTGRDEFIARKGEFRVQIGAGDETTAVNTAPRDVVSVRMLRRAETAFFWSLQITIALMAHPQAGAHRWGPIH